VPLPYSKKLQHIPQIAVQSLVFCTVGGTVKFTPFTLSVVLLLLGICTAQSSKPVPAGMRHAQELEVQNERDSAPEPRRSVNPVALQNQANQLADLAASVPQGVHNANKGLLEKDLIQRLKQIEKLSKQLRSQLDH
jgi:hypothetical protein